MAFTVYDLNGDDFISDVDVVAYDTAFVKDQSSQVAKQLHLDIQ